MTDIAVTFTKAYKNYNAMEVAGFPPDFAKGLVAEGVAKCASFARVKFVAPATIAAPSPDAGIYAASDQLFVFDGDTAAALISAGEAVEA